MKMSEREHRIKVLEQFLGTKLLNLLNLPIMNRSDHLRG